MEAYDQVILAGDIGGTNTNLALVGMMGEAFSILFDRHYRTKDEPSLMEPLGRFLEEARREAPGLEPRLCCISGAGPVEGGRIALTNAPWGIDGPAIEARFGIPTRVINDFTAVSYGILLLDPKNPEELRVLPHCDGSRPAPGAGPKLVLGAGTGLGAGFIVGIRGHLEAFASEGGHVTLPVYNEESRVFQRWLEMRFGFPPGAEAGVSGMGIANLFAFCAERESGELGEGAKAVLAVPEERRPALVAAHAGDDPVCAKAMDMFVKLYARVAADLAAVFIPSGGVYLAGGIASKNEARFLEGDRFMAMFEKSYREHITSILAKVPVMIVKDYDISLLGAAKAAVLLNE
ncbi:MAG: glucokinase [Spirochaetaceae bacterium]|nr:glucokinase [Spirochaetaceae bacterium]